MIELQIAIYTIVPLAFLSLLVLIYFLLRRSRQSKEDEAIISLLEKEKGEDSDKNKKPGQLSDTSRFWKIENMKERARHKVFNFFSMPGKESIAEDRYKNQFKSHNYKIRRVERITGKDKDIKPNLLKIASLHKLTPFSKLRKLSKKPNKKYLELLMEKRHKEAKPGSKKNEDPFKKLASLPDKRAHIINKLRELHH